MRGTSSKKNSRSKLRNYKSCFRGTHFLPRYFRSLRLKSERRSSLV